MKKISLLALALTFGFSINAMAEKTRTTSGGGASGYDKVTHTISDDQVDEKIVCKEPGHEACPTFQTVGSGVSNATDIIETAIQNGQLTGSIVIEGVTYSWSATNVYNSVIEAF